ncbi:hypothetical protein SELMODRAFT_136851 [Selaginella moellendorffii]|uniref:Pentacotripeptide-repeat region of PRORP domain-containing protein n=2 Tax=Selaginella moellendorffii TaxID=88036 RepID=D8TCG9_SELML|nr:hypothetical protein SELMODRAFT_136851 [Selaginella moellendorffii]
MPIRNAVSWSAMIAANAQHGYGREAMRLFKLMDLEGEFPHQQTIGSLIDACSADPSMAEARIIHSVIHDNGFKLDVILSSALINMYGKYGSLDLAREVFETMEQRNIISWNTMVAVYAESGHGDEALYIFSRLHLDGMVPDDATISSALAACCHSGLLEDARCFFHLSHEYGLHLTLENYACVIFLLGKAGRLADAEELIRTMPFEPREATWMTLLSACKTQRDVDLGTRVGQAILDRDPDNAGPYVLLSNVYT